MRPDPRGPGRRHQADAGFTLLELMIAVVIVATLAVVAVAGYKRYVRRAESEEMVAFVGVIKLKQAANFQTYGSYIDTTDGADDLPSVTTWFPTVDLAGDPSPWVDCTTDPSNEPDRSWCLLGAQPAGPSYKQYFTRGWQPSDGATAPGFFTNWNGQRWWVAAGRLPTDAADMDNNDKALIVYLTHQMSQPVIKDPETLWSDVAN